MFVSVSDKLWLTAVVSSWLAQTGVQVGTQERGTNGELYCADSGSKLRQNHKMEVPVSGIFWLHFCVRKLRQVIHLYIQSMGLTVLWFAITTSGPWMYNKALLPHSLGSNLFHRPFALLQQKIPLWPKKLFLHSPPLWKRHLWNCSHDTSNCKQGKRFFFCILSMKHEAQRGIQLSVVYIPGVVLRVALDAKENRGLFTRHRLSMFAE